MIVPLALAIGEGAEQRAPMAHAVIGGLITSTLLTLFVVPVVYTLLDDLVLRPAPRPGHEPRPARGPRPAPCPRAGAGCGGLNAAQTHDVRQRGRWIGWMDDEAARVLGVAPLVYCLHGH